MGQGKYASRRIYVLNDGTNASRAGIIFNTSTRDISSRHELNLEGWLLKVYTIPRTTTHVQPFLERGQCSRILPSQVYGGLEDLVNL
jgi:hypothetical protein